MATEKRIFIVAPYYPPSALPPSQRVRLLVSNLNQFGFEPVIFTVQNRYREEVEDPWMEELVGTTHKIVYVKCLDFHKTRKFGIGDIGLRMLPFLFSSLRKEIKQSKPDLVLYPVPPWNILLVAQLVKLFTGVPYGIDYIDPWIFELKESNFKAKASQWVAKFFERWVVKNSTIIFAVSQGILNDLVKRYKSVQNKPMIAVPYGVEINDYTAFQFKRENTPSNSKILLRYIGAISDQALRVVAAFLQAIKIATSEIALKAEFIGTSYAGKGLAKPRLNSIISEQDTSDIIVEMPDRVTYKKAIELTLSADILLLFGDMTSYYAASKLMGLIASEKPFVAFVHRDSFPASFLRDLEYEFVVEYTGEKGETPEEKVEALSQVIITLVNKRNCFQPVDKNNPLFMTQTARGMTEVFTKNIQKALSE